MADPRRAAVIAEAQSWLGTPYHHMGRVKGAGADCLTLLAEVFERAGVIPHVEVPFYPPDWNLHRDAERYLEGVTRYAREVPYCADGGRSCSHTTSDESGVRRRCATPSAVAGRCCPIQIRAVLRSWRNRRELAAADPRLAQGRGGLRQCDAGPAGPASGADLRPDWAVS